MTAELKGYKSYKKDIKLKAEKDETLNIKLKRKNNVYTMMSLHNVKAVSFRRYISIILIGLGCGGIMTILLNTGLLKGIELKSLDFRFLCRGAIPTSNKIVIIGTDEDALDKIKDPFIFGVLIFPRLLKQWQEAAQKLRGLTFSRP